MEPDDYSYRYINTAQGSGLQIKTGSGHLRGILVGTTTATAFQIIDGTSGTNTNLAELKVSIVENFYELNCNFVQGLRIVCGAGTYTVVYR